MSSKLGHILQESTEPVELDDAASATAGLAACTCAHSWCPGLCTCSSHVSNIRTLILAHLLLADLPHADHGVLAAGTQDDAVRVERRRRDPAVHVWVRDLLTATKMACVQSKSDVHSIVG